tara:strand:- start:3700 stop:4977 length:1278 start_codon:yes stop_codon:yes gene_type:complete
MNNVDFIALFEKLYSLGNYTEMIEKAEILLKDNPENYFLWNTIAVAEKNLGNNEKAIEIHKDNIRREKNNFVAYGNLANIYKVQGKLNKAIEYYEKTLKINPSATDAINNLGVTYEEIGDINKAKIAFEKAVKLNPNNKSANYNLGNLYRSSSLYDKAIEYYQRSNGLDISESHMLECYYYLGMKEEFYKLLKFLTSKEEYNPLIACLSSHASCVDGADDHYPFCPKPLNYIYHTNLIDEGLIDVKFIETLNNSIDTLGVNLKKQPLLINGRQSAGNIFNIKNSLIQNLKDIIYKKIEFYKKLFLNDDIALIKNWPERYTNLGWFVEMDEDGSLKTHIHKRGWISGSFYLKMPKNKKKDEGNIFFTLDGANYPKGNKEIYQFDRKVIDLKIGDIVLFPSSLFHGTIPTKSKEQRRCFAFDVSPHV